jgi:U6 snRNA-associated Sm-like protein LSm7
MSSFKSDRDLGFDMEKYTDCRVRVKFQGGREVDGVLKGYDKLDNLVLDDCVEFVRGTSLYVVMIECLLR